MVHVVFDNESLLPVGGFPTATSTGSDIKEIARAAGVPRAVAAETVEDFCRTFRDAVETGQLTTIVAKVEAKGPPTFLTDLALLENRFQFQRYARGA